MLGFRAKTGRAIAIALSGPAAEPRFVLRRDVDLVEHSVPGTAEPFHAVMDLPWPEAVLAARDLIRVIEDRATAALDELGTELRIRGVELGGVAVVGSPDRTLEKIGSAHVRAHAAEGIAFRQVLEVAAARRSLRCRAFSDRTIDVAAASALRLDPERVTEILTSLGRDAGRPWRKDERAAAAAAWTLL